MLDRVPLEIVLYIISLVPLTTFSTLYQVLPEHIIDEALRIHLSSSSSSPSSTVRLQPFLNLVSTNLCELSAPRPDASCWLKNESWLPLYFSKLDIPNRIVWLFPSFSSQQHYFRVEDAYVSHGKLLLRPSSTRIITIEEGRRKMMIPGMDYHDNNSKDGSKVGNHHHHHHYKKGKTTLASLWDIRKQLPPTRAGTFSGASEFTTQSQLCREMTIERSDCWVDACLLCPSNNKQMEEEVTRTTATTITTKQQNNNSGEQPPRPILPKCYARKIPARERDPAFTSSSACGYFLVERVGLKIPAFLDLFDHHY
ncbi:hypothetical protein BDA99DRAFT_146746 [Phascolomyces articulosus]|uniref:Uncharacterized protein n=1 Tax=Phascolomyces articulosus TaxID=60185 RepID=A0AAD5JUY7_9FUNG|nr:hypothetical protein BDA99DRAFT_146746 [Phascolomyces articulosus]